MNIDYLKDKVKEFRKDEWILKKDSFTLKEDLDAVLKLKDKKLRVEDDILCDAVWDDFFNKYNIDSIVSAKICYKEREFEVPLTLFYNENVIIPFAVEFNKINEFNEYEYEIAKAFSTESNKINEFNIIMDGYKLYSEKDQNH